MWLWLDDVDLLTICELSKGRFTSWTMKLDHERWPFSMVPFLKKE